MSAQRPASPELDADDVADARDPNTEAQVAGCQETGMRVVIGRGGCAGSAP